MKLLLDMNLAPRWVTYLQAEGFEAVHWSQVGRTTASDREIIAYAANGNFIAMTHDLDFSSILAASGEKTPSVIQIRSDNVTPESIGPQIVSALRLAEEELRAGALLTIDIGRTRIRLLPLRTSS